jgi:phage N-6-adenine-methyltransferase
MQTPPELFDPLHERFAFTLDACALPHNAKLERYFTPEHDGLKRSWKGERVWCNPPYSDLAPWVQKARESDAELVVMLVPANRTEQRWWQDHVEPYRDRDERLRVEFLRGRQRFIRYDADRIHPNERPPFGVALLIFDHSAKLRRAA